MEHIIEIQWDDDACVWYAVNDSIPLALESNSFDALIEKVKVAAPEILQENGAELGDCGLCFRAERRERIA